MSTILVVDDEPGNIALIRRLMENLGHDVAAAVNGETGIGEARRLQPDVIILDVNMDGMSGFDAGADAFLTKPFDLGELMARVESLVRLKRQRDALKTAVEGTSDARV